MSRFIKAVLAAALVAVITLALPSSAFAVGGFVSDDFSECGPEGVWTITTPVSGQSVTEEDNTLVLVAVPGQEQTIWEGANNTVTYSAPRAMQNFGGSGLEDFGVEAKFDSQVTEQYQQQGIVIEQDAGNLLRFEFHYSNARGTTVFAHHIATVNTETGVDVQRRPIAEVGGIGDGATSLSLKVTRVAGVWAIEYRADEGAWTPVTLLAQGPGNFTITKVGVFAGTSGAAPGHTAVVDYFFNTDSPMPTEDNCGVQPEFNFFLSLPLVSKQ